MSNFPLTDQHGDVRTVGFELEFSGLSLEQTTRLVCQTLSGERGDGTEAQQKVTVADLGEFAIELDWEFLKKEAEAIPEGNHVTLLRDAASLVVPIEVVCPPIAMDKIDCLDPMVQALHEAGAKGTDDSILAAFGVHINTALPDTGADTIDRYLKAFALLQWWLSKAHDVNLSRRVTPYVDLYPVKYLQVVLQREQPDIDQLISDYLEFNATRNRALDMLPLFAFLDERRIKDAVQDDRIKSRPTFHYRLPNCLIGSPDWSLQDSWKIWLVVEYLANDSQALRELGNAFLESWRPMLGVDQKMWTEKMEQWLRSRKLA